MISFSRKRERSKMIRNDEQIKIIAKVKDQGICFFFSIISPSKVILSLISIASCRMSNNNKHFWLGQAWQHIHFGSKVFHSKEKITWPLRTTFQYFELERKYNFFHHLDLLWVAWKLIEHLSEAFFRSTIIDKKKYFRISNQNMGEQLYSFLPVFPISDNFYFQSIKKNPWTGT